MSHALIPAQEWWTAEEIAAAELPDMPATKRGTNLLADRLAWQAQSDLARRRAGKGGGWEYSWKLFPARAQRKLLKDASAPVAPKRPTEAMNRDDAWSWFEKLPETVKKKARDRLLILQMIEAFEQSSGLGRDAAVRAIARDKGVGVRTIWDWFGMIAGVRADDRLAYLAPRNRAAAERPRGKEYDLGFFDYLKSLYLRLAGPTFTDCYRDAVKVAEAKGWQYLPERTMRRHMDRLVPRQVQVLAREGDEAVAQLYPAQIRDKTALHAMEVVNSDTHTFDVFVQWPHVQGEDPKKNPPCRPHMVMYQDVFSGMVLSYRVDKATTAFAVQMAAGDMIEDYGIPKHILFDNGRENAAKKITGGAANRFRFKVKEDDVKGLFTQLGCQIHWATPYHGQAKPIERAFRDMAQSIAKDVRFDGAYTGNKPTAKPEDYGSRAVPLETFLKVLAERIAEHNTRQNRRSPTAYQRSFAEVFEESYATSVISKATAAQRRLWLLGSEGLRAESKTGAITFQKNRYWADWMLDIAKQEVIIRFDLGDFWAGLHVYSRAGAYLGHAPVTEAVGFLDQEEAIAHNRARNEFKAATRRLLAAHRKYTATQAGNLLNEVAPVETPLPEAKLIKPIFGKPARSPAEAPVHEVRQGSDLTPEAARFQSEMVSNVLSMESKRTEVRPFEEREIDRFKTAISLERQIEAGATVTPEQLRWLRAYQNSSEYRGQLLVWESVGDTFFG